MTVIGLTGGIGSGKSTVAKLLADAGAHVIDADRIGHEVYLPGTDGWDRVVDAFGREVVAADGTIDRAILGRRVFSDPDALRTLNGIVHPLIGAEIQRRLQTAYETDPHGTVVIEAALLLDAGWRPLVNQVWVVVTPKHKVIERVQRQRGMAPGDIEARISAQITDGERRRLADVVIENSGTLDDLRKTVEARWTEVVGGGRTS
jgi:dephospho-CoA kinase